MGEELSEYKKLKMEIGFEETWKKVTDEINSLNKDMGIKQLCKRFFLEGRFFQLNIIDTWIEEIKKEMENEK